MSQLDLNSNRRTSKVSPLFPSIHPNICERTHGCIPSILPISIRSLGPELVRARQLRKAEAAAAEEEAKRADADGPPGEGGGGMSESEDSELMFGGVDKRSVAQRIGLQK